MPYGDDYLESLHDDPSRNAAAMMDHFIAQWSRGSIFRSLNSDERDALLPRLAQILHALSSPGEYRPLAEHILDQTLETVPAARAVLLLENREGQLGVTIARGGEMEDTTLLGESETMRRVLHSGKALILGPEAATTPGEAQGQRCFFPVISDRSLRGLLYLDGVQLPGDEVSPVAQLWSEVLGLLISHSRMKQSKELLNGYLRHIQDKAIRFDRLAAQGRLAAAAGHELANLLTVIAGNLELACTGLRAGERCDRISERLEILQNTVQNASQVCQGMVSGEVPENELQRCSLNALVYEVVEQFKPLVSRRGVRFELEAGARIPDVLAEPGQLRQIIRNLLLNALEARIDVRIQIRVSHDAESQRVKLSIRDNGALISAQERAAFFTPLHLNQEQGVRIGLAICMEIVSSLGGAIRLDSAGEEGNEWSVSLPMYGAETQHCFRKKLGRRS